MAYLSEIFSLCANKSSNRNNFEKSKENFEKSKENFEKLMAASSLSRKLDIDIVQAKWLLKHYGVDYIYTSTGFALPYSTGVAKSLLKRYGTICIVDSNYNMTKLSLSYADIRSKKNKRTERIKFERMQERKLREEYMDCLNDLRRERFFSSMQTKPTPKHGGRANSMEDIGKYIASSPASMNVLEQARNYQNTYRFI